MDANHHHHHLAVRQLDLSSCHAHTFTDRLNAVPGLQTSAAFLTFLRANLVIPPSALSSHANTPLLEPVTGPSNDYLSLSPSDFNKPSKRSTLPPTSPLASAPVMVADDDIPELSLETVSQPEEKIEAVKLVADSVAEMQPVAAKGIIQHPASLSALALVLGGVWKSAGDDLGRVLITGCGVVMAYLLLARWLTRRYIALAEQTSPGSFLQGKGKDGSQEMVIAAKREGSIIGTCVLQLQPATATATARRNKKQCLRNGTGVIRAWTVANGQRGHGVGKELLGEAVRVTKGHCGRDAEVGFAQEHANRGMGLWSGFEGALRKGERRAQECLDAVMAEWEGKRRRR